MILSISAFVVANFKLVALFTAIILIAALMLGYFIGNVSLQKQVRKEIDGLNFAGDIKTSIIDNVNLGVIAYNSTGAVYANSTVFDFPGFLGNSESIPRDINAFLEAYDQDNHLKANYLLNIENDIEVRANYSTGRKIYEIKIIHRTISDDRLDIVIIDDITQIKDDERRQKDLAANVSHELKTPLTVIRASEFFVNKIDDNHMPTCDEIKKWGNRIVTNAVRMQDIVQDFLILSMCTAVVPMSILDINEIVNKALANINDYPNRDKVNIKVHEDTSAPLIFGNSNLVMRVIINMLTNSVKYIDYEGKQIPHEINVSITTIDDRVGIQVEDNGRGIPQDSIDHLFERFYRVDNSGSRDVGGSGIGLAIAKEVAEMHDGTINVVSTLGSGSTFTFVLPSAETVFNGVFDDAKTGIVSDSNYYVTAADFMAMQTVEAAKSMGYEDVEAEIKAYESVGTGEKANHDKAIIALMMKFGAERYGELVEELTFVEEFDDEFDDEFIDDESEENVEDIQPEALSEDEEERRIAEEKSTQLAKEEARKLLTQTILPRNAQIKHVTNDIKSSKDVTLIHPNTERKMYNKNGREKTSLFKGFTTKNNEHVEPERQSAVRRALDEAASILPTVENIDNKGD